MLSLQDKEKQWESFRDSVQFGKHTWITLQLFDINTHDIIETVQMYLVLSNKVKDKNFIPSIGLSKTNHIISQHIGMDVIAKVQILIETTLVLIEAISKGYPSIANTMTYYDQRLPRQIVEKIRQNCYNIRRVIGLPNISGLPLSKEEKKTLARIFQETIDIYSKKLKNIADFYDRYRIIYGKWKHGLTYQTGIRSEDLPSNITMVTALDRKEASDMPKGYFQAFTSDPLVDRWYNAQSILKINQMLEHEILKVTDDLSEIISYMVNNHLTYAKNCGEGYLPIMELNKDTFSFWFPEMNATQEEDQILASIRDKIGPNINIVRTNLIIARIFNDTNITKSIQEDTVTNVWIKD